MTKHSKKKSDSTGDYQIVGDEPKAKTNISIRLPESVDQYYAEIEPRKTDAVKNTLINHYRNVTGKRELIDLCRDVETLLEAIQNHPDYTPNLERDLTLGDARQAIADIRGNLEPDERIGFFIDFDPMPDV